MVGLNMIFGNAGFVSTVQERPVNEFSCWDGCSRPLEIPAEAFAVFLFLFIPIAFAVAWFVSRTPEDRSDLADGDEK